MRVELDYDKLEMDGGGYGRKYYSDSCFGIVDVIIIVIGLSRFKSKQPVGFYTGGKSPRVEELVDVIEWNRRHGLMWMTSELKQNIKLYQKDTLLANV